MKPSKTIKEPSVCEDNGSGKTEWVPCPKCGINEVPEGATEPCLVCQNKPTPQVEEIEELNIKDDGQTIRSLSPVEIYRKINELIRWSHTVNTLIKKP